MLPSEINNKHILLSPHPGGGLTNADATYNSIYGKVRSAWKLNGKEFVYEVTVPANTTATVTLPSAKADQLLVNSQAMPASMKESMKQSDKAVSFNVGSGSYTFSYTMN